MYFLDPVSLARCAQVCRFWNLLANAQTLWYHLATEPRWKLSQAGHHRQMNLIAEQDKKISWKKVVAYILSVNNLRPIKPLLFPRDCSA
jgi:hypothetical protein